jgi:hypothetical protein
VRDEKRGLNMDLSRRPTLLCATWRSRFESSRTANVSPLWRGSLYKVIVLVADELAGFKKH